MSALRFSSVSCMSRRPFLTRSVAVPLRIAIYADGLAPSPITTLHERHRWLKKLFEQGIPGKSEVLG